MNLIDKVRNFFTTSPSNDIVRDDGKSLRDQKEVEDPTGKFASTRFTTTYINNKPKRNVEYFRSEYDLPTIANAIQLDGILRRSVSIFKEQILKNGYEVTSINSTLQTHINRRLKEIELLTGVSFYQTLSEVAEQLVSYGNAYLIKVRALNKSRYGKPYRLYGRENNPVVGLFVAEATTLEIGINNRTQIVEYCQTIKGQEFIWDERDVIHFTYNKIPGTLTGYSSIIPILDDVRALRKLEEEIEILGFQYSIPLYLYKVGNKEQPPMPGEIDEATSRINSMPPYGILVVPGHHTIEAPSNNTTPVEIMEFVKHFKSRIFAGLGISPVAMAETNSSNRNTSEVADTSMQSVTVSYQRIIKHKIELELLREFALDAGIEDIDNPPEFNFPEIDIENEIKFETNVIQKWQNNLITREEARNEMDYDVTLSEEETFLNKVDIPKIQAEAAAKISIAAAAPKTNKATDTKVRPSNQHGKSTGRPKYKRDDIDKLIQKNITLMDSLLSGKDFQSDLNRTSYTSRLLNEANHDLQDQLEMYIKNYLEMYHIDLDILSVMTGSDWGKYFEGFKTHISGLISRKYIKNIDSDQKAAYICSAIKELLDNQEEKLTNLAKIMIYKALSYKTILINAKDCDKHALRNTSVDNLNYNELPPFSYGCKCFVEETGLNDFIA